MIQVHGQDRLSIAREMYLQERRVAVSLAKHVASLLTMINRHHQDWNAVYQAAHIREAKAPNPKDQRAEGSAESPC
jgi:hypothetical protein